MLAKHRLPAERTLRLLPDPIANASPTEHMPARSHARIPHLLQAQSTFPLLSPVDPLHCVGNLEMVTRPVEDRRVRRFLDTRHTGMTLGGCRRLEE